MYNKIYRYICKLSPSHPENLVVAHYSSSRREPWSVAWTSWVLRDQDGEHVTELRLKQGGWGCDGGNLEKAWQGGRAWPPAACGAERRAGPSGESDGGHWRQSQGSPEELCLGGGRRVPRKAFCLFKLWGLWQHVFVCWWEPLGEGKLGQAGNGG